MSDSSDSLESRYGPDLITVSAYHEAEVSATRATLNVNIRGTSYFTGNSALTKAREVGQLVGELRRVGLPDEAVRVRGVYADVSTGALGRTSSVNYDLAIDCKDLDKVADIVGVITAQKNTVLRDIDWKYDGEEAARSECLAQCLEKANAKAKLMANRLGVRLTGIYRCQEAGAALPSGVYPQPMSAPRGAGPARFAAEYADFDTGFSNNRMVSVSLSVAYRVSGFETG